VARALADLVVIVHLTFIVFVALGGLLALRWRWVPWLHLPAVGWAALLELFGLTCPLTPLENWLRRLGGAQGYAGGFVDRYLLPVVYPPALTRELQVALGVLVCAANGTVYLLLSRSGRPSTRGRRTPGDRRGRSPEARRDGAGRVC
jgi:uncharacterized protein DUF2784